MPADWRVIVVTSDKATQQTISHTLSSLGPAPSCCSTVEDCRRILRRDTIDMVFCDERVSDGDYWDIFNAVTRGLTTRPKIVLMSRSLEVADCEQAKSCGMFAVIESPCRRASIEWAVILAKHSASQAAKASPADKLPKFDIFAGAPDRDAMWVCEVYGLTNARRRMDQIAAERPGRYFIFYSADRTVLTQVETFAKPRQVRTQVGNIETESL